MAAIKMINLMGETLFMNENNYIALAFRVSRTLSDL